MNLKRTPAKIYLLLALTALLVIASVSTFTYAQEEGEQQAEQAPASIETQQVEPAALVEAQPTVELPVEQPIEVLPTMELPVEQPVEVQPTVVLPIEQPVAGQPTGVPVLPTVEMVLPTQVIEPVLAQPVAVPFNDSFASNQGWTASGAFAYSNGAQGETTWYADTSARAPESSLEFNSQIVVRGLNQPQIVLRQRGTLSNTDIVLVEAQREGAFEWTPLDQQAGPTVSGDWSARFIDLSSMNGQTIRLRIHVMSFGPVPAGETSAGYAIDELTIREYQAPPATAVPALPTAAPILPTTAPVLPTSAPTLMPTAQPNVMQSLSVVQPQAVTVAGMGTGLTGQYFDTKNLTNLRVTQTDPTINFYWHSNSPVSGVAPNTFSVRWTGKVVPRYSETYTFYTMSDDGVRLWVNGQRIINNWTNHGPTEDRGTITLRAGQAYNIRLDYYEYNASATMTLAWSSRSQAKEIIPQSALFPASATAPTTVPPTATTVAPTTVAPTTVAPTTIPPTATTVPPTTAPTNGSGTGLRGDYFSTTNLSILFTTRTDATVNFSWDNEPLAGMAADYFSVRWTGKVQPRYSETYTFYTYSDDGVRLWVNGQQLVNNWTNHGPTEDSATITLQAGQKYDIVMEYYEGNVYATARLSWSSSSQPKEIIPQTQLYPAASVSPTVAPTATRIAPTATTVPPTTVPPTNTPAPTTSASNGTGTGLVGQYYDNVDFTNNRLTRTDATVNFAWDNEPAVGIDGESFSVRWMGKVQPRYSGTYTFYTYSDDGVRLWVNGQQIINNWTAHGPTEDSATITLQAGQKYDIRMDFYEGNMYATAKLSWSSSSQPKEIIPRTQLYPEATTPIVEPTNTPVPGGADVPSVNIPAPPALPPATGNVIALWDWSDPNIRIYPSPSGAPELGPVSSNDTAADGQGAYTRIVQTTNGDRVVEFMANHDYVQRSYGTAARLFIRNWGYLQPYYGRIIQTDFYMRMPALPDVPVNNPNLVYGLGQQFKHADGVIWAMDAERAPDGTGVSPYIWWPRGSGVIHPGVPFEYQAGVWHRVRVRSLLHNTNGWAEVYVDGQLLFRIDGNVSELWGGGIGLDLYIREIHGAQIVHFSDWRLQVMN